MGPPDESHMPPRHMHDFLGIPVGEDEDMLVRPDAIHESMQLGAGDNIRVEGKADGAGPVRDFFALGKRLPGWPEFLHHGSVRRARRKTRDDAVDLPPG